MLGVRAAVELEHNFVLFDLDVGYHQPVAGLGRCATGDDHIQIGFSGRLELAVGDQQSVPCGRAEKDAWQIPAPPAEPESIRGGSWDRVSSWGAEHWSE